MSKICTRCNMQKDYSLFYKSTPLRKKDDGYDYYCKECRNANTRKSLANTKRKCSEAGCDKSHYAKSLCRSHYIKRRNKENKA